MEDVLPQTHVHTTSISVRVSPLAYKVGESLPLDEEVSLNARRVAAEFKPYARIVVEEGEPLIEGVEEAAKLLHRSGGVVIVEAPGVEAAVAIADGVAVGAYAVAFGGAYLGGDALTVLEEALGPATITVYRTGIGGLLRVLVP